MKSNFRYTGIRVRDLDRAIDFFTRVMGMTLHGRIKSRWTKGEFANLVTGDGQEWLELNWYPADSPVEGPFREGEELDHLGFEVADLDAALAELKAEGYVPTHGPFHAGRWHYAFVPVVDGLWIDLFHRSAAPKKKPKAASRKKKPRRHG